MNATDDLEDLIGTVAFGEYQAAEKWAKPKLRDWLLNLPNLSDSELLEKSESAIYDSALAQRFRGNWEADHCKASAAWFEARRRHRAAGHADDCHGDTIYSRAHASVMRSQGHTPSEPTRCSCDRGDA